MVFRYEESFYYRIADAALVKYRSGQVLMAQRMVKCSERVSVH
jgi:hypothetical protein